MLLKRVVVLPVELSRDLIQRSQQPRETAIGPSKASGPLAEAASKALFPGCPVICHVQSLSLIPDKTLPRISLCSTLSSAEYFSSSFLPNQGIDPLFLLLACGREAFTSVKDETLCDKENT